jgi:glycine/D-amino acid oxidase-like deaminating enzyme
MFLSRLLSIAFRLPRTFACPAHSYLTALRHAPRDSPNYFTLGFSHDWCMSDGFVRISGEDHFSGLKLPRHEERCRKLAEWGWEKYPAVRRDESYPRLYGLYSETPDHMPLVGSTHDDSLVFYMLGCNAWGQASLSACAAMAPGLLGLRELTPLESRAAQLFSIRRFSGKALNTVAVITGQGKEEVGAVRKEWNDIKSQL